MILDICGFSSCYSKFSLKSFFDGFDTYKLDDVHYKFLVEILDF